MRGLNDWGIAESAQALTIDSSTGNNANGIMGDVQIMQQQNVFSKTIVVASSADNTDFEPIDPELIDEQFSAIVNDGEIKAVKVGQLNTEATIQTVANNLKNHDFGPMVLEPVDNVNKLSDSIKNNLLGLTNTLVTNVFQISQFTGTKLEEELDLLTAAKQMQKLGVDNVVIVNIKHNDQINDFVLLANGESFWLPYAKLVANKTFGSGQVISASIAADIAKNVDIKTAIQNAHEYVQNMKVDL